MCGQRALDQQPALISCPSSAHLSNWAALSKSLFSSCPEVPLRQTPVTALEDLEVLTLQTLGSNVS